MQTENPYEAPQSSHRARNQESKPQRFNALAIAAIFVFVILLIIALIIPAFSTAKEM